MEWISVKDRLPEYGTYLVIDVDKGMRVVFSDGNKFHCEDSYHITHWMTLPPKP